MRCLSKKLVILTLSISMLFMGCDTSDEEQIKNINSILNEQFNGPEDELIELIDSTDNIDFIGQNGEEDTYTGIEQTELDKYLEKKFGTYIADNMYDEYIGTIALEYLIAAYVADYRMKVSNIDIGKSKSNKNHYEFTVTLDLLKGGNSDELNIDGKVQMKGGKVGKVKILEDNGLLEFYNH
ncbi:hypothetical protein KQI49_02285 [Virgibacillus sp. MSJ-26]|uniref:hypothetical protein n=1 Tax=Virgibacillus sp. MSJ-26 TaxID=2841522 RepID=UPI001C117B95|nr:hypothetical protein [Virgibacillus sp. MSJ-26]MBU5465655.1 hypothetical protein [Virgibacillus sp. MSJ-26]HLQ83070.1 hypothetical protein [Pseudogracilibacillus sp.]